MTCAFAVRGALKKFAGVDSVDVSLNKGLATVKLKPGNTIGPEQFWETVKKNGFTPKQTDAVVKGEVVSAGAKLQLKVTGAQHTYALAPDPKAPKAIEEARRQAGKTVTIEGRLTPGNGPTTPPPIEVRAVRP